MKVYARIDNSQVGPLGLDELLEAGVRPSTYVWHKGMADWERAEDVPDVCRAMRRALAGLDPITGEPVDTTPAPGSENGRQQEGQEMQTAPGMIGFRGLPEPEIKQDFSVKPQGVSIIGAVIATLICFPITGMIALWFAMKCKAHWKMSEDPKATPQQIEFYQRKAHDDARIYRMMIGITFCLGIIMLGFTMSRFALQ